MKVWDRAGIQLPTPGIAVRHASVARHVTDCATRPDYKVKLGKSIVYNDPQVLIKKKEIKIELV